MVRDSLLSEGFTAHPFRPGTKECFIDTLRTLVATLRFRHTIAIHKSNGVDFSMHLYVPEIDEVTGEAIHQREDHCHIYLEAYKGRWPLWNGSSRI